MNIPLAPIVLTGTHVELRPLTQEHVAGLNQAASSGELWRLPYTYVPASDSMAAYVDEAVRLQQAGSALPFVIVERSTGLIAGSTRFGNVRPHDLSVEIGWTWLGERWQRTAMNTEMKLLLLRHAFETLGCVRVELKTHIANERSRRAIERLGAKQEGILRKHMRMQNGSWRDTVYYSILDTEWPEVHAALVQKLRPQSSAG